VPSCEAQTRALWVVATGKLYSILSPSRTDPKNRTQKIECLLRTAELAARLRMAPVTVRRSTEKANEIEFAVDAFQGRVRRRLSTWKTALFMFAPTDITSRLFSRGQVPVRRGHAISTVSLELNSDDEHAPKKFALHAIRESRGIRFAMRGRKWDY